MRVSVSHRIYFVKLILVGSSNNFTNSLTILAELLPVPFFLLSIVEKQVKALISGRWLRLCVRVCVCKECFGSALCVCLACVGFCARVCVCVCVLALYATVIAFCLWSAIRV